LNCSYCRPPKVKHLAFKEILRFEEIQRFVHYVSHWGIKKIRITGGEPLIKKGILNLVKMLAEIKNIKDLSLTTNGLLLEKYAAGLKEAGLTRINLSLDTLNQTKFIKITQHNGLEKVLAGLQLALKLNFRKIKVNVVVIPQVNDDEILDFVKFALEKRLILRFIECIGIRKREKAEFLPNFLIKEKIEKFFGPLKPTKTSTNGGPACYFKIKNSPATIGFISSRSQSNFCQDCNRLRLTADGRLKPCLLSDLSIRVKPALETNNPKEIKKLFEKAVSSKSTPLKKNFNQHYMFQIGG
jgi:cyclic pyranopterin phosphate synthase